MQPQSIPTTKKRGRTPIPRASVPCETCGTLFIPNPKLVRKGGGRFCTKRCFGKSITTKVERTCEVCIQPFIARADAVAQGWGLYCSRSCQMAGRAIPAEQRAWALIDQSGPDTCCPWTAARDKHGYGLFTLHSGKQIVAHRFILQLTLGRELGPDELACHTCDNPPCCNPAHLFAGSAQDNSDDMVKKGRARNRWSYFFST